MGVPTTDATRVPCTLPATKGGAAVDAPITVAGREWSATCVSMGNPHVVVFVDDLASVDVRALGPLFELHQCFPAKANVEFVRVVSPSRLAVQVWERGVGATLACGTGACAVAVAAVLAGKTDLRKCVVALLGGDLHIEWRETDGRVIMTGPANAVFSGEIPRQACRR
jgi:diaminopimelate epimerase